MISYLSCLLDAYRPDLLNQCTLTTVARSLEVHSNTVVAFS